MRCWNRCWNCYFTLECQNGLLHNILISSPPPPPPPTPGWRSMEFFRGIFIKIQDFFRGRVKKYGILRGWSCTVLQMILTAKWSPDHKWSPKWIIKLMIFYSELSPLLTANDHERKIRMAWQWRSYPYPQYASGYLKKLCTKNFHSSTLPSTVGIINLQYCKSFRMESTRTLSNFDF